MIDTLQTLADTVMLGGPVLILLLLLSIVSLAVIIMKAQQFRRENVGKHDRCLEAIKHIDRGDKEAAQSSVATSQNHLGQLMRMALGTTITGDARQRLESEAEGTFLKLESGLRFLDFVSQVAPLLGLFGTVLGMIEAFQALQEAGSQVDPSVLAGGIWVALLTTAAGLAVAMPVSMALAWLEGQLDQDRAMADRILNSVAFPLSSPEGVEALAAKPANV
ncbi:MAG: MotA/TolQ/ExbB proton channel family protein [Pseudomonadota bacterium]